MRDVLDRVLVATVAPALALAACNAPPSQGLDHERHDTPFGYLARTYDRDGEGAITRAEYGGDDASFARLDANADGKLTAEDFPVEVWTRDYGIRDIPADVRERLEARYAARAVVLAYFRPAPEVNELSREALEQGFARLDRGDSGTLDAAEFARATEELPWGGPGEAWELLLAAVDEPHVDAGPESDMPAANPERDGLVALEELLRYHQSMSGSAGILRQMPGVDPLVVAPGIASDGPPVGSLAPDFELADPGGGARIRLSRWRGEKPVALIFGSFT